MDTPSEPDMMLPSAQAPQRATTFFGLQALRAFAAILVVVHHATMLWAMRVDSSGHTRWWENGSSGVDIFFVISGFVMAVSTIGREHKVHPARSFLARRVVRIMPMYWLITAVVALKLAVANLHPQSLASREQGLLTLPYLLASLFLVPYRNVLGEVQPLLSVGWTLMFEMFFYLLFAAAIAARRNVAVWLTVVLVPLAVLGNFVKPNWPSVMGLASPRLLEFLAGLLLGYAILQGRRINPALAAVLGLASLPVLLFAPLDRTGLLLGRGLPAYLIVQAVVMLEGRIGRHWPRWLLYLGDASYSLYLSHNLAFAPLVKLLKRTPFLLPGAVHPLNAAAVTVILLVPCIGVALLLYRFVEKPMTDTLRIRLLHERRPEARAAG